MKLLNTKTFTLFLSAAAILSMSGCEGDGENGVASEKNLLTEGQPPIAQAGADRTIAKGDSVTLNGQDSYDPDGEIVSYVWSFGGLTKTGMIIDIDNPPVGTATVTLTVEDNDGNTDSDTVVITVVDDPTNLPPEAKATITPAGDSPIMCSYGSDDRTIVLDASASTDPEGQVLTFAWSGLMRGDEQVKEDIKEKDKAVTSIAVQDLCDRCANYATDDYAPITCTTEFNVAVTDDGGLEDDAPVQATVQWSDGAAT